MTRFTQTSSASTINAAILNTKNSREVVFSSGEIHYALTNPESYLQDKVAMLLGEPEQLARILKPLVKVDRYSDGISISLAPGKTLLTSRNMNHDYIALNLLVLYSSLENIFNISVKEGEFMELRTKYEHPCLTMAQWTLLPTTTLGEEILEYLQS